MYHESIRKGVSPDSFWTMTPAEVSSVISATFYKDELLWNHTSSSMALLANVNSSKGKSFRPEQFSPYSKEKPNSASLDQARELYNNLKDF